MPLSQIAYVFFKAAATSEHAPSVGTPPRISSLTPPRPAPTVVPVYSARSPCAASPCQAGDSKKSHDRATSYCDLAVLSELSLNPNAAGTSAQNEVSGGGSCQVNRSGPESGPTRSCWWSTAAVAMCSPPRRACP
eukprot:647614-Amphidinium_carterae.2